MFRNLFLGLSRIPPPLMFLIIAVLGAMAFFLYTQEASKKQAELDAIKQAQQARENLKGTVVYATKDIPAEQEITLEALEVRQEQQDKIPASAITNTAAAVGYVAASQIQAGQMVLQPFVKNRTIQVGFEGKIKEGMRAVTFAIDTNSGVAGFIAPESRVDILCIAGSGADVKAAPVLSDVEVMAVGSTYRKAPGEATATAASTVTVLLSPGDTEKLVKAITAGRPYLTLRNAKDHTPLATVDVTALFPKKVDESEVAGGNIPPPNLPPPPLPGGDTGNAPPPPPPMHEIELWSGSKKEVLSVPPG